MVSVSAKLHKRMDAPPWSTPAQTGGTQFLSLEQFSGKYNYTYQKNADNVAD